MNSFTFILLSEVTIKSFSIFAVYFAFQFGLTLPCIFKWAPEIKISISRLNVALRMTEYQFCFEMKTILTGKWLSFEKSVSKWKAFLFQKKEFQISSWIMLIIIDKDLNKLRKHFMSWVMKIQKIQGTILELFKWF